MAATVLAVLAVAGAIWLGRTVAGPDRASRRTVSYQSDIQPIFDAKCLSCHPAAFPSLDLRQGRSYRQLVRAGATLRPAFERVIPGRPDLSYLLLHVPDPRFRSVLDETDRDLIARWIEQGAKDN